MNTHLFLIYKTTHIASGKFYIGKRKTVKLDDGYLGSGIIIKHSVKKYGKAAHIREILFYCNSYTEMNELERDIVNIEILENPLCMNLKVGGLGGSHGNEKEYWTLDHRLQMGVSVSKTWADPIIRKRRNNAQKLAAKKPETRAKVSAKAKQMWESSEFRKEFDLRKHLIFTEEYAQNMSVSIKEAFKNPINKENHSKGLKKAWADPEYHSKMVKRRNETANTPEFRKSLSDGGKRHYAKIIEDLKALNLDYSVDGWQEHVVRIAKSKNPKRWLINNISKLSG